MLCQKCGSQQSDNVNFCSNCGALLKNDFQPINQEEHLDEINSIQQDIQDIEIQKEEIKDIEPKEYKDKIQDNFYIKSNTKNKGFSSPLGTLSLIFGIISILGVFLFLILDSSYIFYKGFNTIFPIFIILGLILNIAAVYKDKKFKRSVIAFYFNFTAVTFMLIYFIYFALIKFLIF